MAQHFYDNQIRRYLLQVTRMLSNFYWEDGDGALKQIPVTYGDPSRQVAALIAQNSEASMPSVPRIAAYITGLQIDNNRRADPMFIDKRHIRERRYDSAGNEYLEAEGKNYTVERLMPTPYTLTFNADVWSSNTDQKLQILEQLLILFNPSLEIQTTDNYLDWTSLTTVTLNNINWSSKSIPQGTDDQIDISTLTFETPIFINPPAKVKRLGVITNIITSIFTDDTGSIEKGVTRPEINQWQDKAALGMDSKTVVKTDGDGNVIEEVTNSGATIGVADAALGVNYQSTSLVVLDNTIRLNRGEGLPTASWEGYITALPFQFKDYVTTIKLKRADTGYEISGTLSLSSSDPTVLDVNFDLDSFPSDTVISGPHGDRATIDQIINPQNFDAVTARASNMRVLTLGSINGSTTAGYDGPDAWKDLSGNDSLVADAGDIIEWDGSKWVVVFDASEAEKDSTLIYTTNINSNVQYKFNPDEGEWLKAFDGVYPPGTWRLDYN